MTYFFLLLLTLPAFGWESHDLITRLALDQSVQRNETVVFSPLEKAVTSGLKRFPSRSVEELCQILKIQKRWAFPMKLGEKEASRYQVIDILSKYADEPDWGLDQNLFNPDQYPELWTEDFPYVTQRHGLKSQAFRHLFFPGRFSWMDPIRTFQIPMRPLGEGPSRALIFSQLAQDFFENGHPYWGYRFLAWSLHYLEDLFQPFHVNQTPSKRMIAFRRNGWLPAIDIPASGERIGYYHFAFEKWTDSVLKSPENVLTEALTGPSFERRSLTSERIVNEIVEISSLEAPTVGSLSLEVFPKWDSRTDPKHRQAEEVVDTPEWKESVKSHPKMKKLEKVVASLFEKMGIFVRSVTSQASPSK